MMFLSTFLLVLLASQSTQAFQPETSMTSVRLVSTSVSGLQAHALSSAASHDDSARRSFMTSSAAFAASLLLPQIPAYAVDENVDYKAVANDIMDLVKKNPDWGPSTFEVYLFCCRLRK